MGAERVRGTVKKWIDEKGYGFITFDGSKSAFIHHSEVEIGARGKKRLQAGETVEFAVQRNDKGYRAIDLFRV